MVVLGAEAAAEDMMRVALQCAQALLGPHIPQLQRKVVRGCAQELAFPVPAHIRQPLQEKCTASAGASLDFSDLALTTFFLMILR